MKKTKIFSGAAMAVVLGMSILASSKSVADEHDKRVIVPLLSCPFGCGLIAGNTMFSNVMGRRGETLMIAAQETPGFIYNLREMANERHWGRTVFGTEDWLIQLGFSGGSPEIKEFIPEAVPIKFKLLHGDAYWPQGKFFVTTDPNIKTPADMKGRRISLGLRGQSNWGTAPRLILEQVYGITPENTDIRHMSPAALTQQMIDGTTDVIVTGFGTEPSLSKVLIPGPLRQLEASGTKFYYVPTEQKAIDIINEKFGATWIGMNVPAGTLPKQEEDMYVGASRGYKAVHPDFPENVAYRYVMATHKYMAEMGELDPLFNLLSDELMVDGLTEENTHSGAIRAYKELGIWDKRLESTPVTYPSIN